MSKGTFLGPDDGKIYLRNNRMRVIVPSAATEGHYEICEEICPAGFESRRHMHGNDFETFYMVDGSATWEVGGETIEATKGTTIHIPPNVPHKVQVKDAATMLVVFSPGEQSAMFQEMADLSDEQRSDPEVTKPILDRYQLIPME